MRLLAAMAAIILGPLVAAGLAADFRERVTARELSVESLGAAFVKSDLELILLEPACPKTMVCFDHQAASYLIDVPLPAFAAIAAMGCAFCVYAIGRRLSTAR